MKKYIFIVCFVLVIVGAGLALWNFRQEMMHDAASGGVVTDNTDPTAPKYIESTEISNFSCYFSTRTQTDTRELGRCKYELKAVLKDEAVQVYYSQSSSQDEENKTISFQADVSFMELLQTIVREHELAQHNGLDHHVSGLADDFGAHLIVNYTSGERIYAKNNQRNFLSFEAMCALKELFLTERTE